MQPQPPEEFRPADDALSAPTGAIRGSGSRRKRRLTTSLAPLSAAALLTGATAWGLTLPRAGDAQPYHDRVLAASAQAPLLIEGYRGRDAHVATEAVELLRPNLILSRSFTPEQESAQLSSPWVQLLIVQCRDARDILGHWPPVCYEANGYTPGAVEEATWSLEGRTLPGRRYRFARSEPSGAIHEIVVANFLILPDGRIVGTMDEVIDAGGDYRLRYFGAAQVQVLTPARISVEARRQVEHAFLNAHADLIAIMARGVVTPASP